MTATRETQDQRRTAAIEAYDVLDGRGVVEPDGATRWKDVEDLAPALASGRIDLDQLRAVLEAAAEVAERLERDDRWWAPWDAWVPVR